MSELEKLFLVDEEDCDDGLIRPDDTDGKWHEAMGMVEEILSSSIFLDGFDPTFIESMDQKMLDGIPLTPKQFSAIENIYYKWIGPLEA